MLIRVGPDIRQLLISGWILDIEIIRPDIRQFNLLYLTIKITLTNRQNHDFLKNATLIRCELGPDLQGLKKSNVCFLPNYLVILHNQLAGYLAQH